MPRFQDAVLSSPWAIVGELGDHAALAWEVVGETVRKYETAIVMLVEAATVLETMEG